MSTLRLRAPSPALVVSVIALIVALGGTSYAALTLPNNSVGTQQLKNGAVTTKKIKNGAVTAPKIDASGLTVPSALHANSADNASHATSADNASHATMADDASHAITADDASHATTADNIRGLSFTPITLINGWASAGLRVPEYAVDAQGVVHFEGAIFRASGTSSNPFDMPAALAPETAHIDLAVDENGGATGRIIIGTDGTVFVNDDPEHSGSGAFFTSLEGVTYVPGS
jgi:hypothetical protein